MGSMVSMKVNVMKQVARSNSQEFVADAPGEIPHAAAPPPAFEQGPAALMFWCSTVRGVHEHVGVNEEQLHAVHCAIERVAISDIDERTATVKRRQRAQMAL
jgi:hypothetical protein